MSTSLEEALYRALATGGVKVLSEPRRFLSYVLDLCDEESVEMRVFERNCDHELLAPFVEASHANQDGEPTFPTEAVRRSRHVLEHERGISGTVAEGVCTKLGNALTRCWQDAHSASELTSVPSGPQGTNAVAPTQVVPVPTWAPRHEESDRVNMPTQVAEPSPVAAPVIAQPLQGNAPSPDQDLARTQKVATPVAAASTPPTQKVAVPISPAPTAPVAAGATSRKDASSTIVRDVMRMAVVGCIIFAVVFVLSNIGNRGGTSQDVPIEEAMEDTVEASDTNEASSEENEEAIEEDSSPVEGAEDSSPALEEYESAEEADRAEAEMLGLTLEEYYAQRGDTRWARGGAWEKAESLVVDPDTGRELGWMNVDAYMGGHERCVFEAEEVLRDNDSTGYLVDAVTIEQRRGESIDYAATFEFFDEGGNSLGSVTYSNYGVANGQKTFIHATSGDVGAAPYAARSVAVAVSYRRSESVPLAESLSWNTWNYYEGVLTISVHNWSDDEAHVTGALAYHNTPDQGWGIQGTGDINTVVGPHESADITIRMEGWPQHPELSNYLYGYTEK